MGFVCPSAQACKLQVAVDPHGEFFQAFLVGDLALG